MEIVGYSYSFGPITGPRPIDNAKAIRWFHERGITSLELYDPWMEDEHEVLRIEEAIAATGMKVLMCDVNFHVGFRDADKRAAGTDRFHERLRVASRLGARSILILPSMPGWDSDLTSEELREWLYEAVENSLPVARELGLILLVANLGFRGDVYGGPEWVVDACERLGDQVRTVYDVGNFVMAGYDPIAALDRVFPYTVHVHVKDWIPLDAELPGASWQGTRGGPWFKAMDLGEGVVPLPAAVQRLRELGYDGTVSPEYEGPEEPYAVMDRAITYTREAFKSTENA